MMSNLSRIQIPTYLKKIVYVPGSHLRRRHPQIAAVKIQVVMFGDGGDVVVGVAAAVVVAAAAAVVVVVVGGLQVADRRLGPILDAAEGQVQVGASQGGEPGPCVVGKDGRQELVARSEPEAKQARMKQQ